MAERSDVATSLNNVAAVEAERFLIGTLLAEPDAITEVAWLTPEDFQIERHRWAYDAIADLRLAGKAANVVTVPDELRRAGRLWRDGEADLMELAASPPSFAYARHYAEQVRRAKRRAMVAALGQRAVVMAGAQNGTDPVAKLALLTAEIDELYPDPDAIDHGRVWTYADIDRLLGPMRWEWQDWLAKGFVTMVAAEPGVGKSMLALRVAASYILGWSWPDGSPFTGERGRVLWCETESGEVMNRDRMKAWGIPLEDVLVAGVNPLDGISLENLRDLDRVRRDAMREDVRLVVIDSLSGSHSRNEAESEVGLLVKAVAQIARDAAKPIIISHHLNKQARTDRISLLNVRGSTAIAQFVRTIWALDAPDLDDSTALRLYQVKNNVARKPAPIGLRITSEGMSSIPVPSGPAAENPVDQIRNLLLDMVTPEGVPVTEIETAVKELRASMSTARRAKKDLSIYTIQRGGEYLWAMPAGPEVVN